MIKKTPKLDLIPIAKFGKTHGLIGEISIISYCNPPENLLNYEQLFFDDGTKICTNLKVKNKKIIATLDEKGSVSDVAPLVNKTIFISKEDLPSLNEGEFYWEDLIGIGVVNQSGKKLGIVDKIENHGSSDLIFINNSKQDLIVPFIGDFIEDVDLEKKIMVVNWFEE